MGKSVNLKICKSIAFFDIFSTLNFCEEISVFMCLFYVFDVFMIFWCFVLCQYGGQNLGMTSLIDTFFSILH